MTSDGGALLAMSTRDTKIAVVIPCYKVEPHIHHVLMSIPSGVSFIIVVDDASPDETMTKVADYSRTDQRLVCLRHERNAGVGGAMISGYQKALALGVDIVIKIDGDGQMDASQIPNLVKPILCGEADYCKGNRFRDFTSLREMPLIRRIGNTFLSFVVKAATGYWDLFDPTNGYTAVSSTVLRHLPFDRIHRTYFFEISMLAELYLLGAVVKDVPMGARYGSESSNLSILRIIWEFPPKLLRTFLRRILLRHFVYDFSMIAVYLLAGVPLTLFGAIFGAAKWIHYAGQGVPAPTGTVVLPTLTIILGFQLILAAATLDLNAVPRRPLTERKG
jgi:dolichol-phosphate mannosyltransferase